MQYGVRLLLVLGVIGLPGLAACGGGDGGGHSEQADAAQLIDAGPIPPDAATIPEVYHQDESLKADEERLLRLITGKDPLEDGSFLIERHSMQARQKTAALLANELLEAGFTIELMDFQFTAAGTNVIAKLPATDGVVVGRIIVGGHYDTVSGVPGADDNGSGTVAVVAIGKRLAQLPVRHHELWVVLFDLEELGLYGAEALAQRLNEAHEDPELMINVDMIAFDPDRIGKVAVFEANPAAGARLDALALDQDFFLYRAQAEYSSDYEPFEQRGWPVLWLFEPDLNPFWHRVNDTIDNLSIDYMVHVSLWLEAIVADLLDDSAPWPVD